MVKGLCNFGATCYFNTAIQCLYSSSSFRTYVLSETCSSGLFDQLRGVFIELGNQTSPLKYILPGDLLKEIHKSMGKLIDVKEQNDINEFLSIFLDKLNQSISQVMHVPTRVKSSKDVNETTYDHLKKKVDHAWFQSHAKEMSSMVNVTHGQVIHQVLCGHCDKKHHNYEVFTNIPLSIPIQTNGVLLEELIEEHYKDHQINTESDDVKWKCDKCQQSKTSTSSSCIWRLPHLLVFSLKRFDEKLNKNGIPISISETLDMKKWVLKRDEITRYRLVAIAVHLGSSFGGHYLAIIHDDQKWYKVDDESVVEINGPQLAEYVCSGYLFFYERYNEEND